MVTGLVWVSLLASWFPFVLVGEEEAFMFQEAPLGTTLLLGFACIPTEADVTILPPNLVDGSFVGKTQCKGKLKSKPRNQTLNFKFREAASRFSKDVD